jgi:hypothetical protein
MYVLLHIWGAAAAMHDAGPAAAVHHAKLLSGMMPTPADQMKAARTCSIMPEARLRHAASAVAAAN